MAKTDHRVPRKSALRWVQLEACLFEGREDLVQVFNVVLHVRVSHKDVIQVTYHVLDR